MEAYPFHFVSWRCLLCVSFFLLVCVMWCFFSLLCIWFVFRINSIAYIISDVSFIVFMCCFISFQNSCVCVSFFLLVCFFSVCLWFIVVFLFITLCIDLRFVFILLHIHFRCVLCVAPFHFRCFIFICVAPFHFRCVFHSISYSFSGVTIVHRSITNNLYTKSTHQIEKSRIVISQSISLQSTQEKMQRWLYDYSRALCTVIIKVYRFHCHVIIRYRFCFISFVIKKRFFLIWNPCWTSDLWKPVTVDIFPKNSQLKSTKIDAIKVLQMITLMYCNYNSNGRIV